MKYPFLSGLIAELQQIINSAGTEDLGKAIEAKIEQTEREPDDKKRAEIHKEALVLEKELAAKTPEAPIVIEELPLEPVKKLDWKKCMVPWTVKYKLRADASVESIPEGTQLGTLEKWQIKYIAQKCLSKPEKYPMETKAQLTFKECIALALDELEITL